MAISQHPPISAKEAAVGDHQPAEEIKTASPFALIKNATLAGVGGFLLLTLIEQLDMNWRLSPVLAGASERFTLLAYSSINILVGAAVGFLTGVFMIIFSAAARLVEKIPARFNLPRWVSGSFALLFTAGVTAIIFNQFSRVHLFILGLIRELEKLRMLRFTLLNHERASSYLLLMSIITAFALLAVLVRASARMNRYVKLAWIAALAVAILAIYYADSRIEVQLYESTMHRSLFIGGVALAMTLAGTLGRPSTPLRRWWERQGLSMRRAAWAGALALFIASTVFTFWHFGRNENLETQIFYRSTQANQNFKLAYWALDRDRDGYSALLDGGDTNEGNAAVNPGVPEMIGDGIDNNGLGGDLTQQALNDWHNQYRALRAVPSVPRRMNVIYFFIDTVRADHVSVYGYPRKTTPNLEKLAERSVVFENSYSPACRTAEAIPRFMQSSYWDAGIDSWPEVLAHNGYKVMLFPAQRSWDRYARMMQVAPGAQGKPLKENIDFVIETLGKTKTDSPFCAFVYVADPHLPYITHDQFNFGSKAADLYDGELAYTDHHIGRLLDWLDQSGHMQDTMVVIMSDHGESLGERDVYRHASQLYSEQTHVPTIIYYPGLGPRRVSDFVSTIDLGSTILTANGLACPEDSLGVSLLPLMKGEPFHHPPLYAEATIEEISSYVRLDQQVHPERKKYMAITPDGFKIIFNRDVFTFELYDLKNDPKELHNLYNAMPERAAEMKQLVLQYVDIVTASRPESADEGRYSKASGADGDKVEE